MPSPSFLFFHVTFTIGYSICRLKENKNRLQFYLVLFNIIIIVFFNRWISLCDHLRFEFLICTISKSNEVIFPLLDGAHAGSKKAKQTNASFVVFFPSRWC